MDAHSIRTFAIAINRSTQFVSAAVRLRKIKATKIGNRWIIPGSEVSSFYKEPFRISKKEMTS